MALASTLGLASGQRFLLLHVPDELRMQLQFIPDDVHIANVPRGMFDVALVCARSKGVLLKDLPRVLEATARDGCIWVAWPAHRMAPGELQADEVDDVAAKMGLRATDAQALDDTWTATRFTR